MRRSLIVPLLALLALISAAPARAALEIDQFETTSSTPQAGAHPDLKTHFKLGGSGEEVAKDVTFDLPAGMFGNPKVLLTCTGLDFALQQCPSAAQVGQVVVHADYQGDPNHLMGLAPIFSVEPGPDEAARFAFYVPLLNLPIAIPVTVRPAPDYGLRFTVSNITQAVPLSEADLSFWGFPADEAHYEKFERFLKGSPGHPAGCPEMDTSYCALFQGGAAKATVPNRPFISNASVCGIPMPSALRVETYQNPSAPALAESSYPEVTDCETQTFQPVAQAKLTTFAADAPSGLDLEFTIPQAQTFAASPSQLKKGELVLPAGLTINPGAADGQSACSDEQAGFGVAGPGHCPDSAKVGAIKVFSESLPGDLSGSIYLGEPRPGNQYRLFMLADGFGINVKLVGSLSPDPQSGTVTASFDELPRLPFERFEMHLFASDRGILATPTRCAVYTVDTHLSPWNEALPDERSLFGLSVTEGPSGRGCPGLPRPFAPKLEAGTNNSDAGSFSDFTLKLDRADGDQFLRDIGFTMPPGLLASLRGIAYCPESAIAAAAQKLGRAELAAPSCPASSEIGTTNVAAGPGGHPFHAVGKVYLAGPFKGAPLSLVSVTPALAGPYDYGTVVVRVGIEVDTLDAHVTAISDTVPLIVGGIPLRIRQIQVNLTKPNFVINPTNCSPMSVLSKGIGDEGTVTEFSSYFQAVNCASLAFKPRMRVKYLNGGLARAKNPALEFALHTRPGDANLQSIAVTLPPALGVDQRHLGNLCSERQLVAEECEGRAPIGTATTKTPLLDQPLSGSVYAVSGSGGLPRLAFLLNGQVHLVPRAESKTVRGGLKTTVPVVPDAPVGDFRFKLFGGKVGYLTNTRNLCGRPVVIKIEYRAQSGDKLVQKVRVKTPCARGGKKKRKK